MKLNLDLEVKYSLEPNFEFYEKIIHLKILITKLDKNMIQSFVKSILLFIFLFAAGQNTFAQKEFESKVTNTLNKIFELSKKKEYEKVAALFAYTGTDDSRYLKDSYNPKDRNELKQVRRMAKKISAILNTSDSYSSSKCKKVKDEGVDKYIMNIIFASGNQELEFEFAFIELKENYLLVEFD